MGERALRRHLIMAASAVVRWAKRKGVPADSRLGRLLTRKPPMPVIVSVANKNAHRLGAADEGRRVSSSGRHRVGGADARRRRV